MSARSRAAAERRSRVAAAPASGRSRLTSRQIQGGLAVLGALIAGYLSWIALTNSEAFCAGLGQCDAVQSSSYARLLGVPVAVLGVATYLAVVGLLWLRGRGTRREAELALLGQLVVVLVGTAFSAWLTYVELFVIYAVCPWCLASAIVMALLCVLTVRDLSLAGARG